MEIISSSRITHFSLLITHSLLSFLPSVIRALMFQLHAKCSYPLHSTILFLSTHPPFQKKKKKKRGGRRRKKEEEKPTLSILFFSVLGGVSLRFWLLDGFCSNKQRKIKDWKGTFKGAISCLKYYLSNYGYEMFLFSLILKLPLLVGQTAAMRTWFVVFLQHENMRTTNLVPSWLKLLKIMMKSQRHWSVFLKTL